MTSARWNGIETEAALHVIPGRPTGQPLSAPLLFKRRVDPLARSRLVRGQAFRGNGRRKGSESRPG
jgi:hypothetical protein